MALRDYGRLKATQRAKVAKHRERWDKITLLQIVDVWANLTKYKTYLRKSEAKIHSG